MPLPITLAEIGRGVRFEVDEAVAVIQTLLAPSVRVANAAPASNPPTLDSVSLDRDGSVTCHTCPAAPAVLDLGKLLHSMLPHDGTRMPAGLRYVMARALMRTEAPPFDSIEDFASALQRFASPDPSAVLRQLFARASSLDERPAARAMAPLSTDRRRSAPSVVELRRRLREADEERYLLLREREAAAEDRVRLRAVPDPMDSIADRLLIRSGADSIPASPRAGVRFRRSKRFVGGVLVVGVAFGIGYVAVPDLLRRAVPPSLLFRSPFHETSEPASPAPSITRDVPDSQRQPTGTTEERGPSSTATPTDKSDEPDAHGRRRRGGKPAREATRPPRPTDR